MSAPPASFFLCPLYLAVGASIELEIVLVSKPLGLGNVVVANDGACVPRRGPLLRPAGMASPQLSMMSSLTATIAFLPAF